MLFLQLSSQNISNFVRQVNDFMLLWMRIEGRLAYIITDFFIYLLISGFLM